MFNFFNAFCVNLNLIVLAPEKQNKIKILLMAMTIISTVFGSCLPGSHNWGVDITG